jgi:hypothetical protein
MLSVCAIAAIFLLGARVSTAESEYEMQCMANVQGKIAWDSGSNLQWDAENLKQLCAGTSRPEEPGKCFLAVNTEHVKGGVNWGSGTVWDWRNIINLCAGSNDANKSVACFKNGIKAGSDWRDAILICQRALK